MFLSQLFVINLPIPGKWCSHEAVAAVHEDMATYECHEDMATSRPWQLMMSWRVLLNGLCLFDKHLPVLWLSLILQTNFKDMLLNKLHHHQEPVSCCYNHNITFHVFTRDHWYGYGFVELEDCIFPQRVIFDKSPVLQTFSWRGLLSQRANQPNPLYDYQLWKFSTPLLYNPLVITCASNYERNISVLIIMVWIYQQINVLYILSDTYKLLVPATDELNETTFLYHRYPS